MYIAFLKVGVVHSTSCMRQRLGPLTCVINSDESFAAKVRYGIGLQNHCKIGIVIDRLRVLHNVAQKKKKEKEKERREGKKSSYAGAARVRESSDWVYRYTASSGLLLSRELCREREAEARS